MDNKNSPIKKQKLPTDEWVELEDWPDEDECFCDLCEEINTDILQNGEDWGHEKV